MEVREYGVAADSDWNMTGAVDGAAADDENETGAVDGTVVDGGNEAKPWMVLRPVMETRLKQMMDSRQAQREEHRNEDHEP